MAEIEGRCSIGKAHLGCRRWCNWWKYHTLYSSTCVCVYIYIYTFSHFICTCPFYLLLSSFVLCNIIQRTTANPRQLDLNTSRRCETSLVPGAQHSPRPQDGEQPETLLREALLHDMVNTKMIWMASAVETKVASFGFLARSGAKWLSTWAFLVSTAFQWEYHI